MDTATALRILDDEINLPARLFPHARVVEAMTAYNCARVAVIKAQTALDLADEDFLDTISSGASIGGICATLARLGRELSAAEDDRRACVVEFLLATDDAYRRG